MYELRNKNIIVLSPQDWGGQKISKHHYALALAQRGNNVLFIAGPKMKLGLSSGTFTPYADVPTLHVAEYSMPLPYNLSFHLPIFFQFLNYWWVKKIIRKLFAHVDICIDFGHYRFYSNLDKIDAERKFFFPVDDSITLKIDSRGADKCFSVSKNIVDKFKEGGVNCHFIQHGLSNVFTSEVQKKADILNHSNAPIRIGYSGNLMIRFLDRKLFRNIVEAFPDVEFHCFGNHTAENQILTEIDWANWLKAQPNIMLYGILNTDKLVLQMLHMDAFWLCYKPDGKNFHAENSHKILEYLSTGKVVISTPISIYQDTGLLEMAMVDSYLSLFRKIIENISVYNDPIIQEKRIAYALDNTYEKQINRIEFFLNDTLEL